MWLHLVAAEGCGADAPAPVVNYNVTFSVDMNYGVDISAGNPTINGTFNGWCGDCNPLTDDDGDGNLDDYSCHYLLATLSTSLL